MLPSIPNLFVSTIAFFVAAWFIRRYLEERGIPAGMTRSVVIFIIASLLSWAAGDLVDRVAGTAQDSVDLWRLVSAASKR